MARRQHQAEGEPVANEAGPRRRRRWPWLVGLVALIAVAVGAWFIVGGSVRTASAQEAPEAPRVLALQAKMPFQILTPSYLPKDFDRKDMSIDVAQTGPGGEPMVQLTYRTKNGETLYVREWVPVNPALEILATSRPIQTKWGKGWLLTKPDDLVALWVDVGPTRASVYTADVNTLPKEQILAIAEHLGPPSNNQTFTFVVDKPTVREMAPPPPEVIPVNARGIQEFTLVITPGGYSPLRFSVKKGVPVKMTFRQLGEVGCGDQLIFPTDPQHTAGLKLKSDQDSQVLEFTPPSAGTYQFYCSHQMYKGVMTVRQ